MSKTKTKTKKLKLTHAPITKGAAPQNKHLGALTSPVMVYLTAHQKQRLDAAAGSESMGLSGFIRTALKHACDKTLGAEK